MAAQIQTWIQGHCSVSITNTQASGFSPFHMLNFIGVPCVESLLEETQQLQSSHHTDLAWMQFQPELSGECYGVPSCSLSTCKILLGLEGLEIIQDWGVLPLGVSIREEPLARKDLKSQFMSLLLFCVCVASYLKWISKGYHFKHSGFYIPRAEFSFAPPQVDSSKINGSKWILQRESKSHANLAILVQ